MSLIPKPGKDHTLSQNFHPISVINNDLKIFDRILADRLALVITSLISPCQTGFIPTRQITDNICLAANVIQDAEAHSSKVLLLSLDTNKAFNSVLWPYLDSILSKIGINGAFINGFKALYHHPRIRIKLPGCNSEYFPLGRGASHGCPLSPLLFALAIEPLVCSISSNPNIKGYVKNGQFKMSFYADDVLLFITDPLISLPNLLNTLDTFHHLTGRVNQSKCIALPINLPQPLLNTLKTKCEFTWSSGTLPYLGIRLAPFLKLIYMHNYPQSFSNIKQLLTQWSSYHISFLGRIQAIKMSFLSKLLFYFRSLPIYVPHSTIMAVQSELLKFVWQNKKPCMSRLLMHRAQSRGVLGCPDLWKYYLALRLHQLAQWHTPLSSVQWLQFKSISVVPFYLPGLLWSSFVSPKDVAQLNGIVGQSLYLWFLYKVKFKLLSNPPCLASFLGDIQFPPAFNTDQEFASWTSQGLVTLDFLLQGSSFCTFELLQHNYALHRSEFYKYLQILHFFTSMVTQKANSVKSPCENLCGEASRDRGILYKYLNDHDTTAKSIAMLGWEARVDQEIPVEDWYDMVSNMHK